MRLINNRFERYRVIDELLSRSIKEYPNMDKIIAACQLKLKVKPAKETIQKDLARMKEEFKAPIYFNRLQDGYEYTISGYSIDSTSLSLADYQAIDEALQLLRSVGGTRVSEKFNHALDKLTSTKIESILDRGVRSVLQTMNPPSPKGFENFDLFYIACKNMIPVSILHFSFSNRTHTHFLVHPFLIKEFDNRWYVIGYSESHRSVRTFGLDSISEPFLIKKRYIYTPDQIKDQYVNDMYGVIPLAEAQLTKIEISVDETGTHYFQSYKLHNTQDIDKHEDGKSTITFNLIPTVELARYFNIYSRQIVVKKPLSLVNHIKNLQNE